MAKVAVPDTSSDQSVVATALGGDNVIVRVIIIRNTGANKVHVLRQDTGDPPTCATVIADGYPLNVDAVNNDAGDAVQFFDPHGRARLSRVFAACSSGSSELRLL